MSHILYPPHSSVCSEWQLLQKACWGPQWNQPQRSCSWPVLVSDSHTQYIGYLQYYSAHASGPVKHRTLPLNCHCVPFQVWMDGCHSWRSRHEFQGPLPDREMFIKSQKKHRQQRSVWVLEGQCPAESSNLPQQTCLEGSSNPEAGSIRIGAKLFRIMSRIEHPFHCLTLFTIPVCLWILA